MDAIEQAVEALRQCEAALRGILAGAVQSGDYDSVLRVTQMATQLRRLLGLVAGASTGEPEPHAMPGREARHRSSSTRNVSQAGPGDPSPDKAKPRRRAGRADYPVFAKSGADLVKVGWSKRSRTEYQQRTSLRTVKQIVAALVEIAHNSDRVRLEQVLPTLARLGELTIPTYQAYVVLAWLRSEGLVKQLGRQGYSVPDTPSMMARLDERWQALPEL
jgi:hypothetical protein